MHVSEPFSHFAGEYLASLYEVCPTAAAADGVHTHDDLLEDLSRPAIDARIRELGGWARRLDGIAAATLTPDEILDRRMLGDRIRARLFALEEMRDWQRSPFLYADTLARSLSGQVLHAYAPLPDRARRVGSKLRQVPRLIEAARQNVTDAPGLFVKVGIDALDAVRRFIEGDLPRAFRDLDDLHLLGDLADASGEAVDALGRYADHVRTTVAPRSRASFRIGRERFERKLRLDDGIDLPAARLLEIAGRELEAAQAAFVRAAAAVAPDPRDAWRRAQARHPAADALLQVAGDQVTALRTFLERKRIVTIPEAATVRIRPTPGICRQPAARLRTSGPFEPAPPPACYDLAGVDPAWPQARQDAHLRGLSHAALWSMAAHEVFPGRYLQIEHLRRVASPVRKSTVLGASSFITGWAHYAGQMVLDEGFETDNPDVRLGQLAEALVRLARAVVGIRLHTEDLSVEQGVRFFRDEAYLEEDRARQEAERGTFDPGYMLGAFGKQMLLKLRADAAAADDGFALGRFHDRLLAQGAGPFWMHRSLMVGGGPLLA